MGFHIHLRSLLRSRSFLIAAVALLGLGLGVNIILFNTVYALLWRPLGFSQPDRLVSLIGLSSGGDLSRTITGHEAATLREQTATVAASGIASSARLLTLWDGDDFLELNAAAVDSGYFRALGIRPVAGRFFGRDEDLGTNTEQSLLLTESAWRSHFAGDPSAVGHVLELQEGGKRRAARIIGIVPGSATLPFASKAEILVPLPSGSPAIAGNIGNSFYSSLLRLQPGLTLSEASARIDAVLVASGHDSGFGTWGRHWVQPLRSALAPLNRQSILLLYGSACLLLLLTCANLASLFVARAMGRTHETCVHLALGATRGHLLYARFQEALLVCLGGTALAFLVESWARPLIPNFKPELKVMGPELLNTSPALLAFGMVICLAVAVVVSIAPGWRLPVRSLVASLNQGGRGGSPRAAKFRAGLAAAQLAIVLTLLTVAGLVGRSFLSALHADPGFDPRGVVTFQATLPITLRNSQPAVLDLVHQIETAPGVNAATFAAELPVGGTQFATGTAAHPGELRSTDPMMAYRLIGPGYFETLGAHMAAGRPFSPQEIEQFRTVAILNQTAARLLFPDGKPLGRTVHSGWNSRVSTVVGVVKDLRSEGLDQAPAPMVYVPYLAGGNPKFIVRSTAPLTAQSLLRARTTAWNAAALLQRFKPLDDLLNDTVRDRILAGILIGGFAVLGLMISSVGLYGTLAAQVQQQRRETGIRIALGAGVRSIMLAVLAEGMQIVAMGAVGGLAISVAAARLVRPHLYGVGPLDPVAFTVALALLSVSAMAACLIPAIKAARVDPIQTLNV